MLHTESGRNCRTSCRPGPCLWMSPNRETAGVGDRPEWNYCSRFVTSQTGNSSSKGKYLCESWLFSLRTIRLLWKRIVKSFSTKKTKEMSMENHSLWNQGAVLYIIWHYLCKIQRKNKSTQYYMSTKLLRARGMGGRPYPKMLSKCSSWVRTSGSWGKIINSCNVLYIV